MTHHLQIGEHSVFNTMMRANPPREMAFSETEYHERLGRVRTKMADRGIDVLLVTSAPNLCYLTGYDTIMPTCYVVGIIPATGDVALHLPEEDVPAALITGWVRDFIVFDWASPLDAAHQLAEALAERGLDRGTVGVEMRPAETYAYGAMDAHTYLRLGRRLANAELVDATDLIPQTRVVKSAAELAYMRRAGELTQLGVDASIAAAAEGVTDNDLAVAGYSAMVSAGSELMSVDPIVLVGKRGAWSAPHATHKRVSARRGDAIQLEYSGNYYRYNAPLIRSATVGQPAPAVAALAAACIEVVEILLSAIRAGRTGHDIATEAAAGFRSAPRGTHFHGGYGYAVGLAFPPTWTEAPVYIAEGIDHELEPGTTLHLPIWAWVPGEFTVGFSETVHVTATGAELLTPGLRRELISR